MASFYVHGYQEEATEGTCDRCERSFRGRGAYEVSYDGVVAKYRICAGCHSFLVAAFGVREPEGGEGRPHLG